MMKKKENKEVVSFKVIKGLMPTDPQIIADVYAKNNYNAKQTAQDFGIALRTIYSWLERDDVKPLIAIEKEIIFDLAKENLKTELEKGNWKATELALKMLGKEKGFSEKMEVVHSGKIEHQHIQINYILPDEIQPIETEVEEKDNGEENQ